MIENWYDNRYENYYENRYENWMIQTDSKIFDLDTVFPQIRPAGITFLEGLQLRVLLERRC